MLSKFVKILMKVQYVIYGAIMVNIIYKMVKQIKRDMKKA
jgi:hypothetical protein